MVLLEPERENQLSLMRMPRKELKKLATRLARFIHSTRVKPKPARNRGKGLEFERDVAIRFREVGFLKAKRHLEFQVAEAADGVDIHHVGPFRPQCKNLHAYASPAMIHEVKDRSGIALLFTKAHGKEPMVVMRMEDFFAMVPGHMMNQTEAMGWTNLEEIEDPFA